MGLCQLPSCHCPNPIFGLWLSCPLAVLTGRLCAAVGMCRFLCVYLCVMERGVRRQTIHLGHTNMWLYIGLSFHFNVMLLIKYVQVNILVKFLIYPVYALLKNIKSRNISSVIKENNSYIRFKRVTILTWRIIIWLGSHMSDSSLSFDI